MNFCTAKNILFFEKTFVWQCKIGSGMGILNMKKNLIFLVSLLIISCATKGNLVERKVTPDQYYRIWSLSKALVISGSLDKMSIENGKQHERVLKVYINNEIAINGALEKDDDELKGQWNNKKVSASC
ncbi:MAG: hypothetical protein CTY33_04880, partial [Methylotenera sp.]